MEMITTMKSIFKETLNNITRIERLIKTQDPSIRTCPLDSFIYNSMSIKDLKNDLEDAYRKEVLKLFVETLNQIRRIRDLLETKTISFERYHLYSFQMNPLFINDLMLDLDDSINNIKKAGKY